MSPDEIQSQGFVTVNHTLEQLKKLNDFEKHVIAKEHDKVVGYVLAMTQQSKSDIPILFPMFDSFDKMNFNGQKINEYHYIVVGQVCVDKAFRGQGIFDKCYDAYKEYYKDRYDFAITEIAATNTRSLQAHRRIGFKEINSYFDKTEWIVVVWDWKASSR
ncbi:MAG: GNAT family N-acetyltransferase [Bacteroidetes bacterium]|nr:GNAT family N-acetyltransferase [Bacteroidota bacterium]